MDNCLDCFHYKACSDIYNRCTDYDFFPDDNKTCENFVDKECVEIDQTIVFIKALKKALEEGQARHRQICEEKVAKTIAEKINEQPWNRKLEVDVLKFEPDKVDISKELKLFREAQLKEEFKKSLEKEKK